MIIESYPLFFKEEFFGLYPVESVVATIEVKSALNKKTLLDAEKKAKYLYEEVYKGINELFPLCAVVGFGGGIRTISKDSKEDEKERKWLKEKVKYLNGICIIDKYSWFNFNINESWRPQFHTDTNEETKRFFAVILDNIRTISERRLRKFSQNHNDWFSNYIRDIKQRS